MKVQHFLLYGTLDPKYGGPTYSVPTQCIGVQKEGAEVSLVVYEASRPFEKKLKEAGVEVIHLPDPKGKFEHSWATKLKRYLSRSNSERPDVMHFHGIWMPANIRVASYGIKHHIPYVINPRGDLEITRINYNVLKKWKKRIAWRLYGKHIANNAACVIATSLQEHNSIRQLGCKAPIAIIPNGIDLATFPQEVVHHHGEKKVVLFLSRVNPIKGIEFLIEAWSRLDANLRASWELHIVGNSDPVDYIKDLKKQVDKFGIGESVRFVGALNGTEKLRKYQDSNLFILPTLNENFGNVVAEAMMCECPVITTKNAPWSCLKEENCGWWIDLSVDNITLALREAMGLSDDARHELGKKSRECIINRYAATVVAKNTKLLYNWVLGLSSMPEFVKIV